MGVKMPKTTFFQVEILFFSSQFLKWGRALKLLPKPLSGGAFQKKQTKSGEAFKEPSIKTLLMPHWSGDAHPRKGCKNAETGNQVQSKF